MSQTIRRTVIAAALLLGMGMASSPLMANNGSVISTSAGLTLLKMGWTYAIAFPPGLQPSMDPASGLTSGAQTYRITAFGGEQWYQLQRVAKRSDGGWFVPAGATPVWVNLNHAVWAHEVLR